MAGREPQDKTASDFASADLNDQDFTDSKGIIIAMFNLKHIYITIHVEPIIFFGLCR